MVLPVPFPCPAPTSDYTEKSRAFQQESRGTDAGILGKIAENRSVREFFRKIFGCFSGFSRSVPVIFGCDSFLPMYILSLQTVKCPSLSGESAAVKQRFDVTGMPFPPVLDSRGFDLAVPRGILGAK